MANRKKPMTEVQRQKKKQIARIKKVIASAEKRGYQFGKRSGLSDKSLERKSLESLKAIKPQQIYAKAHYVTAEGKKISGAVRREQERSASAKKASATRKQKREAERAFFSMDGGNPAYYGQNAITPPPEYMDENVLRVAEISYEKLMQLIEDTASDAKHWRVGQYVKSKTDEEIAKYDLNVVMMSINDNPAVIEALQKVVEYYKPSEDGFGSAYDTYLRALEDGIKRTQAEIDELNDLFADLETP